MGLDNDVGTIVSFSYRIHPGDGFQDKARLRYQCKAVPKTAGAHGSCVQRDTFWPSVHEAPTVVIENQGVFLERESIPYDQGHVPIRACERSGAWSERGVERTKYSRSAERVFIQRPERSLCLAPIPLTPRA